MYIYIYRVTGQLFHSDIRLPTVGLNDKQYQIIWLDPYELAPSQDFNL